MGFGAVAEENAEVIVHDGHPPFSFGGKERIAAPSLSHR